MNNRYIFLSPKLFHNNIIRKNDRCHGFTLYYPGCSSKLLANNSIDCAICLNKFSKVIARPENCDHIFCSKCLMYWSSTKKVCPLCRRIFDKIVLLNK